MNKFNFKIVSPYFLVWLFLGDAVEVVQWFSPCLVLIDPEFGSQSPYRQHVTTISPGPMNPTLYFGLLWHLHKGHTYKCMDENYKSCFKKTRKAFEIGPEWFLTNSRSFCILLENLPWNFIFQTFQSCQALSWEHLPFYW